ncbi:hypothetical protein Ahy_B09g094990 isoform A [Arachis hypogaea]|uniref:Mediator complex subunit 15 KIX domain-containing protein n=2 Tax=Arachis hypogaea TaxID=3818 RepID=A0A444XCP2_ARAHY|nr:hypothetical protein Ahy_B09g094990 isoform A [Arachis hypogaea]
MMRRCWLKGFPLSLGKSWEQSLSFIKKKKLNVDQHTKYLCSKHDNMAAFVTREGGTRHCDRGTEDIVLVPYFSLRSNSSIITAVMDTSNWRDELQPAFRQRFFNNILHNLQLGHPPESFDEILEFHKIAHSIEQKSYAGATSQAEYVMQIARKMLLLEKAREREWRDYFCPDSRQRIVYKIMKLLKRHLDVTDPEGSQELWRIAERLEEKIFSKADTETDYLRKITIKMHKMENTPRRSH